MTVAAATVSSSLRGTEVGLTGEYRGDRGGQHTLFITALIGLMHRDRQDASRKGFLFQYGFPRKLQDQCTVTDCGNESLYEILIEFMCCTNSTFNVILKSLYLKFFTLNMS